MSNEYTTNKVSSDMINMMAKQMGAVHIKSDPAYINIYTFEIAPEFRIKYMLDLRRRSSAARTKAAISLRSWI